MKQFTKNLAQLFTVIVLLVALALSTAAIQQLGSSEGAESNQSISQSSFVGSE